MVLDTGTFTATVLTAVILASAARTIIPWLSKRQADITAGLEPRPFSIAYLYTAILGAVPVLVGAILLLPTILTQVQNTGTQLMVFVTGFGLAYATTDLVNRNVSAMGISVPLAQINQTAVRRIEALLVDKPATSTQQNPSPKPPEVKVS